MLRFLGLVLVLCLLGCDQPKPTYPVVRLHGTVKVAGEPLKQGLLSILPEPGTKGAAVGVDIVQGKYQAANVPKGKVRVVVQSKSEGPRPASSGDVVTVYNVQIPQRYQDGVLEEFAKDSEYNIDIPKE